SMSVYQTLYDTIMSNIESFINGIGNGTSYDIRTYNGKHFDLKWDSPLNHLSGAALEEYLKYVEDMHAYLKGKKERCEVYKYDPVNMCNGNYINEHTDITLGGRYELKFERFYNSIANELKDLGWGWTHNFEVRIYDIQGADKIRIAYADGSEGTFKKEKNFYVEEHGEPGILEKLEDGMGYIIRQDDGSYEKFDGAGLLVTLGDIDGDHTVISYELLEDRGRRLKSVETKNGNSLTFTYYEDGVNAGLISKVTDHTGRFVCYTYDEKMQLTEITELDGAVRKFTYTEDGKIKDVINPKGIVAITNEYDKQHRTVKQSFPDNSVMTYEYDDINKTTTATEQNGNKVVYTHDDLERHTATEYYDGTEYYTYNTRNQKTSFTDKRGNTTRFAYDNKGHLTKIVDALGNKTFITYRADGKPMAVKGPKGEEYKYGYNLEGKLFELRNPLDETNRFYYKDGNLYKTRNANGGVTLFDYDEKGNVNTITDPDGVVTEYAYDELNRVVETTTADGAVTTYEYDKADRIVKTTDALGNTREYTYDEMGKVTSVKEADGTVKSFEMNIMGRVSKVVDEAGFVTEITYNVMGKQEEVILPNGGTIKYEYDPLMRLTKVTDPEGRTSGYEYDKNGNVTAEYLGDIRVRSLEYDELNRVTKETDALGHEKTYAYDENGNVIEATDTLGNKFTRDYDLLGRVISETDALGNKTSYTYTKLGNIETITDPAGRVRKYEYTDGGKLKAIYFCGRLEQSLDYDTVGRIVKRSFADGYEISYSYDVLSRIAKVEGSDGRTVSYEYDAMGRATKVADGRSTTLYTYTATGRLKSVLDALGNETAYTYDALDNLKSVHRAEGRVEDDKMPVVGEDGHVTLYSYDLSGQLTKITDALGQEETYEYDQYGRLVSKNDRDGYKTTYVYDITSQVSSINYADGRCVELSYDALGKLIQFKDWLGVTSVERDAMGRVLSVIDYNGKKVSYTYGKVSERTSITYPDGKKVDYIYDDKLQLSELRSGVDTTNYVYDEFGRLTLKLLANGASTQCSYLPGGYLNSLEMFDSNGVLDKYTYKYDVQGNRAEIERFRRDLNDISGKYKYEYDLENRLTQVSFNGDPLRSYSYDAFGNRSSLVEDGISTQYNYDVLDRLIESVNDVETKAYGYDKRGNQTSVSVNGIIEKTFTFDASNMLSKATDAVRGEATYSYNGFGKRVAVANPEEKIEYLLDLTKDYHNMLERTVNGETEVYTYDSNVVSMSKAGNDYFYMLDELGTGMYLTGTDGVATSTYAYDEFGRNINPFTGQKEKPAYTKKGNIIQPLAFTGYQHDEITGSYFAQARYYDSNAGRFVSEDKVRGFVGSPNTINHYLYCWNSPVDKEDLDGNFATIVIGAAIGGVIGGGATVVSSLVKGEDISWKEVGKNALIGVGAGAAIGTGVGAAAMLAECAGASATVATGIAVGGGAVGTASATIEATNEIKNGQTINMNNIVSEAGKGTLNGMIAGASLALNPVGAGSGFIIQGISDAVSGEQSSIEAYTGAMFAGAIVPEVNIKGMSDIAILKNMFSAGFLGGSVSVLMGDALEVINDRQEHSVLSTALHSIFSGVTSGILSPVIGYCLPFDVKFLTGKNYGEEVYKILEEYANFALEQLYQEYICGEN
ncbi:DUF6531 domain-containing protein, partial [Butyrivibrio fibrisolvens]|nr:DUF6531 domain-containing protein [Butyrivibrio fibrisolvens]